jgi:hypothetical protein
MVILYSVKPFEIDIGSSGAYCNDKVSDSIKQFLELLRDHALQI